MSASTRARRLRVAARRSRHGGWRTASRPRCRAARRRRTSQSLQAPHPTATRAPPRVRTGPPLRTRHRVDLSGACRQRSFRPVLTAIVTGEHLAAAGRAEHALGLALVEGEREHRALGLHAHVHAREARAAVLAAEQHAEVALETRARGHPDGLRITGDFADITAIRLALRVQRVEPRGGPVRALIAAGEEPGAADGQHRARTPGPDEHAVHVHGVVVHVLPVAHVVPVRAAVEAPDDTADFDGAVELVGIGGIDRELQYTLGGVGAGSHGDFEEANAHRNLLPVLAAVVAAEDFAVLVAG